MIFLLNLVFYSTNIKTFLNQDKFTWEAKWHQILNSYFVFWKKLLKLNEFWEKIVNGVRKINFSGWIKYILSYRTGRHFSCFKH